MRTIRRQFLTLPIVLSLLAGMVAALPVAAATPVGADSLAPHVPGVLLVGFRPGATAAERASARASIGVTRAAALSPLAKDTEKWTLRAGDVGRAMTALRRNPMIRFAEPDYLVSTLETSNDPQYTNGSLWGMYGAATSPTNQYGSNAAAAWSLGFVGSRDVYIGIIDEGYQFTHPDLAGNAWLNPYEIAGNGVDDDGNGFIDDVRGWDFYEDNASVYDGTGDDHGTHVAGTIGGVGGNGIGVAGVNWNVSLISGKFLGPNGGSTSDAVGAVDYMTDLKTRHGLNIVATSNSWGGGGSSQALLDAINRGGDAGILFIAAAGNSTSNNDLGGYYPSGYQCTNGGTRGWDCVISVAAIASNGTLASFSSYGATTVDLGAPGVSVTSTLPTDTYGAYSGTSMATPHVSGAAALCASIDSRISAAELKDALLGTTVATASLSGKTLTGGRLDAGALPSVCTPTTTPPSGAPTGLTATSTGTGTVALAWTDGVTNEIAYEVERATGTVGSCGTFTAVARIARDSVAYTVGGLSADTNYCFRVRGWNSFEGGTATAWSNLASARTAAPPPAYQCRAVAYEWVDPAGGSAVGLSDDSSVARTLPFTFTSYGVPYTTVQVASNGYLRLGSGAATAFGNIAIPNTGDPNAMLAPAWDDWNPGLGGTVSTKTVGTAPNRRYVVSWIDVPHYNVTGSTVSFQAILEEGGDVVRFQYADMTTGSASYDRGLSATAGVEGATGEWGTQISNNQSLLVEGTAYRCSAATGVPPTIAAVTYPDGTTGTPYAATNSASGGVGPYAWTISTGSLPTGLALDAATGAITGTPTSTGTASFTLRATGADGGTTTAAGSIRVAAALAITTTSLAGAAVDTAYSATLAASGGTAPVTWALAPESALPAGLTLSSGGTISGTPTAGGTTAFTVVASDAALPVARRATRALEITVGTPPSISGPGTYPDGTIGVAYTVSHSASNGLAPYTWSIVGGSLPAGTTLNTGTGTISGTPTTAGSYSFTLKVAGSDAIGSTVSGTIRVAAPLSITTSTLAAASAGSAYSATLVSSGGQAPIAWTLVAGTLPAGLTLSASGTIAGTPTETGSFTVTVRASDDGLPTARVAERTLTLSVPFAKSFPANGAKFARGVTSASLTWYPFAGATGYEYCFATSTKACTTWVGVAGTSVTRTGLSNGATYYWQVRAIVGGSRTAANNGTIWKFSISR